VREIHFLNGLAFYLVSKITSYINGNLN
jgi:hypothetical protein